MNDTKPWDYEEHKRYLEQSIENQEKFLARLKERLKDWIEDHKDTTK